MGSENQLIYEKVHFIYNKMNWNQPRIWFYSIVLLILIALIVCSIVIWGREKNIPETFTFTVDNTNLSKSYNFDFTSDSMKTLWIDNFIELEQKPGDKSFYFFFQDTTKYPIISTGKNIKKLSFLDDIRTRNGNKINTLNVRRLKYLETLNLNVQSIPSLQLINHMFLKEINGIILLNLKYLELRGLPALTKITFDSTLYTSMKLKDVENLIDITSVNGKLKEFKVPNKKLVRLDLTNNSLTQDQVNAIMIDIRNNNIKKENPSDNYYIKIRGPNNATPTGEGLDARFYIQDVLQWIVWVN